MADRQYHNRIWLDLVEDAVRKPRYNKPANSTVPWGPSIGKFANAAERRANLIQKVIAEARLF
jgi:hypothetical protein